MKKIYQLLIAQCFLFIGLVSYAQPGVTTYDPAQDESGVDLNKVLQLTFDEDIQANSAFSFLYIKIFDSNDVEFHSCIAINGGFETGKGVSVAGNVLTIDPTTPFSAGEQYYVTIDAGAIENLATADFAGIDNSGGNNWRFTIASGPSVTTFDPLQDANDVGVSDILNLTFDQNIKANPNFTFKYVKIIESGSGSEFFSCAFLANSVEKPAEVSISNNVLTINPTADFTIGESYYVTIDNEAIYGVNDIAFEGIDNSGGNNWRFSIANPEVPTLSPVDGANDVSRTPTLTATFSDNITLAEGNALTVYKVGNPGDSPINLNIGTAPFYSDRDPRLSINGASFTIDLSSDILDANTQYGVFAGSGVIDVNGTPYNGFDNISNPGWSFTTATDLPAPTVQTYDPVQDATGVSIQKVFNLTFDMDIQENQSATPTYLRLYENGVGTPVIECLIDNGVIEPGKGVSLASNVLTIDPTFDLNVNTQYYFTIDAGAVESLQGAAFAGIDNASTTWRFTTEVPPVISVYDPVQDATEVALDKVIQLTFDKNVEANPTPNFYYIKIKDSSDDSEFLSIYSRNGSFESGKGASVTNNVLTIDAPSDFEASKTYYFEIDYGAIHATDGSVFGGIDNSGGNNYRFSTATNPPAVTLFTPLQDAVEVPIDQVLSIQFDKDIQLNQSATNKYVYVYDEANPGSPVYQCILQSGASQFPSQVYISGTNTLVIDPTVDFEFNTNYYVVIDAGAIEALSGDPYAGIDNSVSNNWRFATVASPVWATNYPAIQNQDETTLDLVGQTDKSGNYYYVITSSAVAPTEAQIEAGQDENGQPAIISGNNVMTANTLFSEIDIDISILTINIDHYIYVLAKDGTYGLYSTIEQLSFIRNVTNNWTGNVSNVFNEPGNWSGTYINQGSMYVPASASNFPLLDDVITVNNIEIEAGAELTVGSSGNVTVLGTLDMYSSPSQNASLITDGTLAVNSSDVRVHQQITANDRSYYMAAPVSGATFNTIGADIGVFNWDNSTGNWSAVNPASAMVPTTGYVLRSNNNLVFTGTLNNGLQTATVYRTESGLGWNLIGNPYPSAIDWTSPNITKTDIVDAFWVFLNDQSIYGVYNASIGEAINIPNARVPSQHAFWVKVLEGAYTQGDVRFTNGSRIHNDVSYLKSLKAGSDPVLKLASVNETFRDEIVIAFNDNATDELDVYDCEKKFATSNDYIELYTAAGMDDLCINSLLTLSNDKVIPLKVKVANTGTYKIEKIKLDNFDILGIDVFLKDLDTGEMIDLATTDSYTFTIMNVVNAIDNKFELHFTGVPTDINGEQESAQGLISVYSHSEAVYVKIPDLNEPEYKVYDLNGQMVTAGILSPSSTTQLDINKTGVYIVKVSHSEGVESKKIVIK